MILVLALIVFAVSAYQLFGIIKGYMDGRNEYEEIRDLAIESSGGDDEPEGFRVNFDELLAVNPDTIGWIQIPNTVVDYPVMQSAKDNPELYLRHGYDKKYTQYGCIFLDANRT